MDGFLVSSSSISSSSKVSSSSSLASSSSQLSSGALVIQGEDFCTADGALETANSGYEGSGYLNGDNNQGASASWVVSASSTETVTITIRFANGKSDDRSVAVVLNGDTVVTSLSLASTGSWTTWSTVEFSVTLTEGRNELTLVALTENGPANIDQIIFSSENVSATTCEEELSSSSFEGNSSSEGWSSIRASKGIFQEIQAKFYDLLGRFQGVR
ncbi:MAG TPA: carbohydrate-binding protein [Fibrobacteraceae bacterium]|nr:carbohydrate-binding protein [Fibrobacteraceae bacterium]